MKGIPPESLAKEFNRLELNRNNKRGREREREREEMTEKEFTRRLAG